MPAHAGKLCVWTEVDKLQTAPRPAVVPGGSMLMLE